MPDSRFYEALGPVSAAELAALTGSTLMDPALGDRAIEGVAPLGRAGAREIGFLSDSRHRAELAQSAAGALFIREGDAQAAPAGCALLISSDPLAAYARAARRLHGPRRHPDGPAIHPQAEIEPTAVLAAGVAVGPGARVGAGTTIGPNSVIGPGVAIGRDCRIGANVSIGFALIGDRVEVFSGAVIGEAGFGVGGHGGDLIDIPQLGRVVIQDDVTIGALTCIDRGAWEDTSIGEHTKIDNLVQIAHNVRVGRNCLMAAQVGISGSVTIGDGVMFGGRAAVADHLEIGAGAKLAGTAGVMRNVPPGEVWCGTPARPIREFMRETAWLIRAAGNRKGGAKDE
jgi:UDP-3-O-[3-hydroxymyristoyl] glucosamine N-acyltransferase